jgi:hypothetical protein
MRCFLRFATLAAIRAIGTMVAVSQSRILNAAAMGFGIGQYHMRGHCFLERVQLLIGHHPQETLQQYHRFPQAGIQVEVACVHGRP